MLENKKFLVYSILNIKNGMKYYGSSVNFERRRYAHKYTLDHNTHDNPILQYDWNIFGEESFTFNIEEELENMDKKYLISLENSYIISNNTLYPNGYNLKDGYGNNSDYLKNKISESLMGDKNPMFGKSNPSMSGKTHSEETKKKLSILSLGNTYPLGVKVKKNTSSKHVGVTYIKSSDKWQSRISYKTNRIQIGYFNSEKEAAIAYDLKAIELFGTTAKLNFPLTNYR